MACRATSCLHQALFTPGHVRLSQGTRRAARNCQATTRRGGGRVAGSAAFGHGAQEAVDECRNEASTSGHSHLWEDAACHAAAALVAGTVLLQPGAAHASGLGAEAAPPGILEFIITSIDTLGPWGPAAFVATVAIAESIPLFLTQPLSLASGLLFGAQKGSLCMLSGTTLAALLAFQIARGIGRPLAERIINHELSSSESDSEGSTPVTPVQQKLVKVQAVIERGSFWQQAGAVLLLRMTPVVPFSASNYVLGLSPMPLALYLAGTVSGMAFWSVFYASLGGASRSLLRRGMDPDVLLADLLAKAGTYTRELAIGGAVLGGVVLLYFGAGVVRQQLAGADGPDAGSSGGSGGDLGRKLGGTLTRSAAASKQQLGSQLRNSAVAGKDLGSEISGEFKTRQELVSNRFKDWLGNASIKELAESHVKE